MSTRRNSPIAARKGFSLGALLLAIAIIAISLAMVRAALQWNFSDQGPHATRGAVLMLILTCALAGGVFSLILAIWSHAPWPYVIAALFGGAFLGAGAGAQATLPVPWTVICAAPIVVILSAMVLVRPKRSSSQPDA